MFRMQSLLGLLLIVAQCYANIYDADEDYKEDYEDGWITGKQQEEIASIYLGKRAVSTNNEKLVSGKKYNLERKLKPGDVIEVHGSYGDNDYRYSVNLMSDNGDILFHVNPRPGKGITVMNNRVGNKWKKQVNAELPDVQSGEDFAMKIVMSDDCYQVLFNDVPLSQDFIYRNDLSLVKSIMFKAGNNGFSWKGMTLNGEHKFGIDQLQEKAFEETVANLEEIITNNVHDQSINEVKQYANSTQGSIELFQWRMLKKILGKNQIVDLDDSTLQWILSNKETLEMLMTSGDVRDDNYKEALEILVSLINVDPLIKTDPLRRRLAVATALTFSISVPSMAVERNSIDWMKRYSSYLQLSEEGVLLEQFYSATAWHLRYVVGSWQTDEELAWARANTPEGCDDAASMGRGPIRGMVRYTGYNKDGVHLSQESDFYYKLPITLKTLHMIGGVCGAKSKFQAGMIQAHGVPALPMGTIRHCAFAWWKPERKWSLDYHSDTWADSKTHTPIQYTWRRPGYYFLMMESAQSNFAEYRQSEKMRIAAKVAQPEDMFGLLEEASTVCPYNFDVWVDLKTAMAVPTLKKATVQSTLLPVLQRAKEWQADPDNDDNIALTATVKSENFVNATGMVNGTKKFVAKSTTTSGYVLLEFPKAAKVSSVYIKWWAWSKSKHYDVYAMGSEGEYVLVKTQADERVEGGKNPRSFLDGWEMMTNKIKIEMRDGRPSKETFTVIHIALWELIIKGRLYDYGAVSDGKPVTSSELSTGAENLVDSDENTLWSADADNSWFEIDLGKICVVEYIEFSWVEGAQPDHITISYNVGDGLRGQLSAEQPFDKVAMMGAEAVVMRVEMSGGNPTLREVKVYGIEYSTKQILKLKVDMVYKHSHPAIIGHDVKEVIDQSEYTD